MVCVLTKNLGRVLKIDSQMQKIIANVLFVVSAGSEFGLGHFRRMASVANSFKKIQPTIRVSFYLVGWDQGDFEFLHAAHPHWNFVALKHEDFEKKYKFSIYDIVLFDLHETHITNGIFNLTSQLTKNLQIVVAIDHLALIPEVFTTLRWVPSFYLELDNLDDLEIFYGWDCYLLEKKLPTILQPFKNRILILTGGSDVACYGDVWPELFNKRIACPLEIHWVRGPFSKSPKLPSVTKHKYVIHESPNGIDEIINCCDFVLSVYGVSVFEALMYSRDCIIYSENSKNEFEINLLNELDCIDVAVNGNQLIKILNQKIDTSSIRYEKIKFSNPLIDGYGSMRLVDIIFEKFKMNRLDSELL